MTEEQEQEKRKHRSALRALKNCEIRSVFPQTLLKYIT